MKISTLSIWTRNQWAAELAKARTHQVVQEPLPPKINTAYLKHLHTMIYQDAPSAGVDIKPGAIRPDAQRKLESVLNKIDISKIKVAKSKLEVGKELAALHTQITDARPFDHGSDRIGRVLTYQIAKQAGWKLDWQQAKQEPINIIDALSPRNSSLIILAQAEQLDREHRQKMHLASSDSVSESYSKALGRELEIKTRQVERLETKLKTQIQTQSNKIRTLQPPKKLKSLLMPCSVLTFQNQKKTMQARHKQLEKRLDQVKKIKTGMTVRGHKLNDFAVKKLRYKYPILAEAKSQEQGKERDIELKKQESKTSKRSETVMSKLGLSMSGHTRKIAR